MSAAEAEKTYQDGNHQPVPASELAMLDEGEKPWALDVDGAAVRNGDYVLVVSTESDFGRSWVGAVAVVKGVQSGNIYAMSRAGSVGVPVKGLHHVTAERPISVEHITYPARSSWAIAGKHLRRIDLSSEEGKRIMLASKLGERAAIDEKAAQVENDRVRLSLEIRRLREDLGDVE